MLVGEKKFYTAACHRAMLFSFVFKNSPLFLSPKQRPLSSLFISLGQQNLFYGNKNAYNKAATHAGKKF